MSVKHAITVSTVPAATSSRSASRVSIRPTLHRPRRLQRPPHPVSFVRDQLNEGGGRELSSTRCLVRRGRPPAPHAWLRPGAVPRDGRLLELRHLVHDHL